MITKSAHFINLILSFIGSSALRSQKQSDLAWSYSTQFD